MSRFTRTFTAGPEHIDELGHVNNAVWVQWVQDVATSHWEQTAAPRDVAAHIWVVVRHEIDYRGNIADGESAVAETWVPEPPKGARFDRHVTFRNAAGKAIVAAVSTWAMLDRASGRLLRVPPELAAQFLEP